MQINFAFTRIIKIPLNSIGRAIRILFEFLNRHWSICEFRKQLQIYIYIYMRFSVKLSNLQSYMNSNISGRLESMFRAKSWSSNSWHRTLRGLRSDEYISARIGIRIWIRMHTYVYIRSARNLAFVKISKGGIVITVELKENSSGRD